MKDYIFANEPWLYDPLLQPQSLLEKKTQTSSEKEIAVRNNEALFSLSFSLLISS